MYILTMKYVKVQIWLRYKHAHNAYASTGSVAGLDAVG